MDRRTLRRLAIGLLVVGAIVVATWNARHDGDPPGPSTSSRDSLPARRDVATRAELRDVEPNPMADEVPTPTIPSKPPGKLFVRVVAREDDLPIVGATLHPLFDVDDARSDADGEARFDVPLKDADAETTDTWVEVAAPGRVREDVHVQVKSNGEQRETVRLRPAYSIDGIVRDAADKPVAGAHVSAQEANTCCTPYPEVATAESGPDGRFRVDGLPFGSPIRYEIGAPRLVRTSLCRRPHDTAPLDVRLEAGGIIRGVVRTPDGATAHDGTVVARTADEGDADASEWIDIGADGRFEIDSLPLGRTWTVTASHSDFTDSLASAPVRLDSAHAEGVCECLLRPIAGIEVELMFADEREPATARLRWSPGGDATCAVPGKATLVVREPGVVKLEADVVGLRRGSAEVEVGPGESKSIAIRFEKGATLSGIVVDDLGAPVADASVRVDPSGPGEQGATSGADGTFVAAGLAEGRHVVRAALPDRAAGEVKDVQAPGTGVRLVVPRNGEAALRLRLPDGAPTPSKCVVRWHNYPTCFDDQPPWSDGLVVRSLPPGEYLLDVKVEGYASWHRRDVVVVAGGRNDLGEIPLDPGLPVVGRVVDPEGRGVPHVGVFGCDEYVETDADGRFRVDHVAAGPLELRFRADDWLTEEVMTELSRDSPPLVVALRRGAVLRVRVHAADPKDLRDLRLEVAQANGEPEDCDFMLEEPGRFSARLSAGPRRIRIPRDEGSAIEKHVDLREDDDVTVEFDLAK